MNSRDRKLLVFYLIVFAFGIYTNKKIQKQQEAVEELRQLNKDTWVL